MNKLLYSLGLLGLLATASCKDDDGAATPVSGDITFEGKAYTGKKGMLFDFGNDGSHYNYDFVVVDAVIVPTDLVTGELNAKFFFWPELYSPGTDKFRTGTFNYNESPAASDYYFNVADLVVDSNNDGKLTSADQAYVAEGGTITVSGTASKYTMSFDITMEGGKKLKGAYTGEYQYMDAREDESEGGRRAFSKSKLGVR